MLDHPGLPVKRDAANAAFRAPAPHRAVDPPLLPGMRRNYLVFFNTGIKVSGGGPREPSLLIVNTSPIGCPWQFTVIVLLVEV
jgi:hypothetical protein